MNAVVGAVVNRRSVRKYQEFQSALAQAWIVLEDTRRTIEKLPFPPAASRRAWSREELLAVQTRAEKSLQSLEGKARRYQAELVSFEWRI